MDFSQAVAADLPRLEDGSGAVILVTRAIRQNIKMVNFSAMMIQMEILHRSPRMAKETRARQAIATENKTDPASLVVTLVMVAAVDLLRPDGGGMMTLEEKRALIERTLEMVEVKTTMVERTLEMVDTVEMDRAPTMIAVEGLPRLKG